MIWFASKFHFIMLSFPAKRPATWITRSQKMPVLPSLSSVARSPEEIVSILFPYCNITFAHANVKLSESHTMQRDDPNHKNTVEKRQARCFVENLRFQRKFGDDLCGGDGTTLTGGALSWVEVCLTTNDGLGLLDDLLAFGKDEFDVARVGHVWVDLFQRVSKFVVRRLLLYK